MSVHVMSHLWHSSPSKGSKLLLLLAMADVADDDGSKSFLSLSSLAKKVRMSRRQIIRLLGELVAEEQLELVGRSYRGTSEYRIRGVPPVNRASDKLSPAQRRPKRGRSDMPAPAGDIPPSTSDKFDAPSDIAVSPNSSVDPSSDSSIDPPAATAVETIRDQVHQVLALAHDATAYPHARKAARKQLEAWGVPFEEVAPAPALSVIEGETDEPTGVAA